MHQLYSWDIPDGKTLRISNVQNVINPSDIESDLGISLNQFVDWKSLTGDTTDNITSIPGLGPVKAAKLITEYETLDNIPKELLVRYKVLDSEEVSKKLEDYREANELTFYRVEKDYGYFWKSLENKKRELLTNEEYNAILSILSPELFEEIDYNEAIQINRVLITLPFAQESLSS